MVLYTDGITEAKNINRVQCGLERLCEVVLRHWQSSAPDIRLAPINDLSASQLVLCPLVGAIRESPLITCMNKQMTKDK